MKGRPSHAGDLRQLRAAVLATLTCLLMLLGVGAPVTASAADPRTSATNPEAPAGRPAARDTSGDVLEVEIVNTWPTVLTPGENLNVVVRAHNRTLQPMEGAGVELSAQSWTPTTRYALGRWLDMESYAANTALATVELPVLAPGTTAEVRFEVPAEEIPFSTWGGRGIEVRSVLPAPTDDGDVESATSAVSPDRDRSWITWWNEPEIEPAPVGVLVPVTPTSAELSAASGWQARYDRLLTLGASPGVTLLVDPAPLAMPTTTQATRDLLTPLLTGAHELWSLPWAWADTAALIDAERPDLVAGAAERSVEELEELGVTVTGSLEGTINPTRVVADAATTPLLLTSSAVPGWYTTGTPATVVTVGGRPGVVLDQLLEDIVAGTSTVDGVTYDLTPSQQRQLVAATTAATVREDSNLARPVLVSLPPDDAGSPNPVTDLLAELPWVTPVTLSQATSAWPAAPDVGVQVLPSAPDAGGGGVTPEQLQEAAELIEEYEVIASVVANPAAITTPELGQLDLLAARAWRGSPGAREQHLDLAREAVNSLQGRLTVTTPANVLMVSESSNFPLTIANDLATDATVLVSLTATDLRLQQVEPQLVTVQARNEVRTEIPVTAVGSGDLTVDILLSTPDGQPLGEGQPIEVRMRADWENTAMIALIMLAVTSFGFGIFRTIRRNKKEDRSAVIEDAHEQYEAHLARLEEARRSAGRRT